MRKKIFVNICLTVMIAVILFGTTVTAIGYGFFRDRAESELRAAALTVTAGDFQPEEIGGILKDNLDYQVRFTLTDLNGNVLYDNLFDAGSLENHSSRKEIKEAIEKGTGSDERKSGTSGGSAYYYAVKKGDMIYRFCRDKSSLFTVFITFIPALIVVAAVVIAVSAVMSARLANNTVRPIKEMVENIDVLSESQQFTPVYPEFEPIVEELQRLSSRLSRYIARLKKEKEKTSLISDNMIEGTIILDKEQNIISVNKSAIQLLRPGFTAEKGSSILELFRLADGGSITAVIRRAEQEGSANQMFSCGGKQIQTYVNKTDLNGEQGYMVLMVDATERLKADEIRKDFSANVSHELKTPLTTIKGFGELLEKGIITDTDSVRKYGGTIYRESERLLLLINDIIRLSEIEEASPEDFVSDVALKKSAEDAAEILQLKADSHNVTVSVEGEEINIKAEPGYISELFLNLIDNSIKYNNEGGHVWVNISTAGADAVVSVKDDGIGIPEEHRERIFERFYRVDKSRSKQTGGTGLGLSIVKHIVSYHGGNIVLESEVGSGTEVTITLPIDKSPRKAE